MKRTNQFELPTAGLNGVFNLAGEAGDDPFRVERENWARRERDRVSREFSEKMQLQLAQCPGFIGADAPTGLKSTGHVVIDPGKVVEATAWLKRRYHVDENMGLSDNGLVLNIVPRRRDCSCKRGSKRVPVSFGKLEQFELGLANTESEQTK